MHFNFFTLYIISHLSVKNSYEKRKSNEMMHKRVFTLKIPHVVTIFNAKAHTFIIITNVRVK